MLLGWKEDGSPVRLDPTVLLRHVVVLGASGSGKTVTCKAIVEEAVRRGISVIAIDPQGDIASMAKLGDTDETLLQGVPREVIEEYRRRVDVKIWTPASSYGIPLSVSPIVSIPEDTRTEDKIRAFGAMASALGSLAGDTTAESVAGFGMILEFAHERGIWIENLSDFADWLGEPHEDLAVTLDSIMPKKDRLRCERKLRARMLGANRLLFTLGKPIDVATLLGHEPGGPVSQGKARVSVVYLNSLPTQEEKEFFVAALANAVYGYMLRNPSPDKPQGIFYLDEAAPFMPPVRKPASKESLMLLMRQARKYGICMNVATQSPGDLDYKALGQVGTWLIGRLSTEQDRAKVDAVLRDPENVGSVDADAIMRAIAKLPKRHFALVSPDAFPEPVQFKSRYLITEHVALNEAKIESLVTAKERQDFGE
jgi:DNA helicase HerA-like ATPase